MKHKIEIQEEVKYVHEVVFETPSGMSEYDLENILNGCQFDMNLLGWGACEYYLKSRGIKVLEICTGESDEYPEVEIIDLYEVED